MLARTFSATLRGVPLWAALDTIAAKTGVRFVYSATQIPVDRRVSLVVDAISVRDAMAIVLGGDATAVMSPSGAIRLEPGSSTGVAERPSVTRTRQEDRIAGHVRDSTDQSPVPAATVLVTNTTVGTTTNDSGAFTLRLPADAKSLTVRRIGFLAKDRARRGGQTRLPIVLAKTCCVSRRRL